MFAQKPAGSRTPRSQSDNEYDPFSYSSLIAAPTNPGNPQRNDRRTAESRLFFVPSQAKRDEKATL